MANRQTESTNRWMDRNGMTQMNTAVPKKQLDAFDKAAKVLGVSRRVALLMLMDSFESAVQTAKGTPMFSTPGTVTMNVTLSR